jgi:hypothetical protein
VRKIASILLLALLVFNWVGYQFMSSCLQDRADARLRSDLDANKYDETDLISIKVPANYLSSYVHSNQFERVDGKVDIEGVQYNYVKRRIVNDSLEFLCIPSRAVTQIQSAKDEFFKLVNDLQHPGQGKKSDQHGSGKNFTPDFYTMQDLLSLHMPCSNTAKRSARYLFYIPASSLSFEGQPPEVSFI